MIKHLQNKTHVLTLLIALLVGTGTAWAYDFSAVCPSGQTLYYNITDANNHYVALVYPDDYSYGWGNYTKPSGDLTIPETVTYTNQTYTVTTIGGEAFCNCTGLTSVIIPNSVTSIGNSAFAACAGLTSITIPNSVTSIEGWAFRYCTNLLSIEIPNSITSIETETFSVCTGLLSVEIPNSVTSIGASAFLECSGLTSITIPNSVTSIGGAAFCRCSGLTLLCIDTEAPPAFIVEYGYSQPFDGVNKTIPVYMPCGAVDAYTSAAWGGFSNFTCNVPITVPISPVEGGTVTGEGINIYGQTCTLTATANEGYAFINWMEDGAIVTTDPTYSFPVSFHRTLEANFASKDNIAFADANVKALCVAPATGWDTNNDGELSYAEAAAVTSIGTVFKGKNNIQSFNELQYFTFLTTIEERAFMGCTALAEITIPERITSIGDKAFVNCPALATVHFNAVNCSSMNTVYNNENYSVFMSNQTTFPLTNLIIGSNVQNIPDYAFRGCNQIQNLTIPASVTTVGDHAFYECTNLTTLTIDGGEYGEYAFFGCSNLETLTIGEDVTSIGGYAFWNCPALTTVHFNATNCISMFTTTVNNANEYHSVFNSGTDYMYDPCPIVTLTIGENVTNIPDHAFHTEYFNWDPNTYSGQHESYITSVIIPNSVTSIGAFAFCGCNGLNSLTIPNSVTTIGRSAFASCTGLTGDLIIPNSVTTIGVCAFSSCIGLTGNLIIPNSVTTIGSLAFNSCKFTGDLIIPNSITTIGGGAFEYCTGFTGDLIIPNSITTIEDETFWGCTGFTGLIIPNSVTSIGRTAFIGCTGFTGSLIIPNSVTTIGEQAFVGCGFTALISEKAVPPTTNNNAFESIDYSIPVYVPAGKVSDYQNANGWRNFTNYKSQVNFVQDGNDQWSDDFNWSSWEVPGAEDVVCITDNCQLDVDANVLYVYIADDEKVLTVNSGKTLNTTYGVHIENASQLMVEDGAQVISNIPFSGTVKKHIDAYNNNNDGWNFIASPVTEDQSISGLFPTGGSIYDLYYLDEENTYWRNYKVNAFDINHNQGYLYANQAGTDINFSGTMQPYVADGVSIPLTKEGEGWNLVGNPFTFNAYANKPYYVINGRNIEAAASGAIAPCTGIVVKANGTENEAVTFTKDAPVTSSSNHGSLLITLTEANIRGTSQIDNAIVSFNESDELGKFYFGKQDANIYIPRDGEEYAIANTELTGETPLNFKATRNGEYTLMVNPESVEMEYLHLIDNITGTDMNLLATPSYTFTAKADDYASRFRLVFSANNNNLNNDDNFAFISNGQLVVNSEGTLQVFDALGRQLYAKELSTANYQLPIVTSPGVYVLRLINGGNVKTQKIVVK